MTQSLRSRFLVDGIVARHLLAILTAVGALSATLSAGGSSPPAPPATQTSVAPETNTTILEPGKPLERTLNSGETHSYQLSLQRGQCAAIQAEQRGIDEAVPRRVRHN